MRTVITYGTFDLFHIGHVKLLRRARELGDKLIVAVSSDEFNRTKGKLSVIPYAHRSEIIASVKGVDLVIPETDWGQKERDIKTYSIDTLVMGDDWAGKFDEFSSQCKVVYLPRTDGVSSTDLKAALATLSPEHIAELKLAIDVVARIARELK